MSNDEETFVSPHWLHDGHMQIGVRNVRYILLRYYILITYILYDCYFCCSCLVHACVVVNWASYTLAAPILPLTMDMGGMDAADQTVVVGCVVTVAIAAVIMAIMKYSFSSQEHQVSEHLSTLYGSNPMLKTKAVKAAEKKRRGKNCMPNGSLHCLILE